MKTALDKQGQALHAEIDIIIQEKKKDFQEMDVLLLGAIKKREDALNLQ